MRVSYALMVMAAAVLAAEGAPQGFFDSFTSSVGNGWDSLTSSVSDGWDFTKGAVQGTGDMYDAYSDMKDANWKNSDKYFHSRGNYDAAQRGSGGAWAAGVISDVREWTDQNIKGDDPASSAADQEANEWGRGGGDPNKYRPAGLPEEY